MKSEIFFIFFFLILLFSCNNENQHSNNNIEFADTVLGIQTVPEESDIDDTIIYDTVVFPNYKNLKTKILTDGEFHNDEVWSSAKSEKWLGLFYNNEEVYVDSVHLIINSNYDVILDDENEKTGWKVSSNHIDTAIIYLQSRYVSPRRNIHEVKLTSNIILPNDSVSFMYSNEKYTLIAKGEISNDRNIRSEDFIYNYKLYLKSKTKETLLCAEANFDDQMIEIMFVGDIDGDNVPDMIINTSRHYNASVPTLYLSKPASKNDILVPVGYHESIGC